MKKIITILLVVLSLIAFGQDEKKQRLFEESIEAFKISAFMLDEKHECKRITRKYEKYYKKYSKDGAPPMQEILEIEKKLNSCIGFTPEVSHKLTKEMINEASKILHSIKEKYPYFDYNIYENEIVFFELAYEARLLPQRMAAERSRKAYIRDSIVREKDKIARLKSDSIMQVKNKRQKLESHFESVTHNENYFKYYTQFTGMRINFVNMRVQAFMSFNGYALQEQEPTYEYIIERYIKKSNASITSPSIYIKYNISVDENDFIISSCEIYGFDLYVIEFFIKFWNTTMQFHDVKNKGVAFYNLLEDKISLECQPEKDFAKITIKPSGEFIINEL